MNEKKAAPTLLKKTIKRRRKRRVRHVVADSQYSSQAVREEVKLLRAKPVIPYPKNQAKGKRVLRIDRRFRSHGPTTLRRLYRKRSAVERVVSRLKTYFGLRQLRTRGLSARVPRDALSEDLVQLGAALATSGAVGMYHIPGLTPEARTQLEAFGREQPEEKIHVGKRELRKVYEEFTTTGKVDCVVLGCPHYTLRQIGEIATMLQGKKVHGGVRFWIHPSEAVYTLAERVGYTERLRRAGGLVTADTCTPELREELRRLGSQTVATDSAKNAYYTGSGGWHKTVLGSAEECVAAAVKGECGG